MSTTSRNDVVKRFGPAGEGYEYHHIVEQGPSSATVPAEVLQSTRNIIRVPRLLHEDITAAYERIDTETGLSLRDALRGLSFERQRASGLDTLRRLNIVR